MDTSSSPRGQNSSKHPSWATVVSTKSPDAKHGKEDVSSSTSANPGKVTFRPKGAKNGLNHRNGQRFQQSRASNVSNSTKPPVSTFRDQYLQQIEASEQSANRGPGPVNSPAGPTQEAQSTARLMTEIASLKATVATLNDDLSRRSNDLIQAKTDLAVKDAEIESLKHTVTTLNDKLGSTEAANKANDAILSTKDNTIKKLQYENASLRDAIHTGVISITQVYGPGGTQAFTNLASKEADTIEQATKRSTNSDRNVQSTKPQPNSTHASKRNGGPPNSKAPHPARDGTAEEALKKARKPSQHVREVDVAKENPRLDKVQSPKAKDHDAAKDHNPGERVHLVVEEMKLSVQAHDSSSKQDEVISSNTSTTSAHHDGSVVKDSGPSTKGDALGDKSPRDEASAPSTEPRQRISLIDLEKSGGTEASSLQVEDNTPTTPNGIDPTSGKYAFKGQESMDLKQRPNGENAIYASTITPSSKVDDDALGHDSEGPARPNSDSEDTEAVVRDVAATSATPNGPRLLGWLTNGKSIILFHQNVPESTSESDSSKPPAGQTDADNNMPRQDEDGWVNVSAKKRSKRKAKGKAKQKAELTENLGPQPKVNDNAPGARKPVPREKGVPAKSQKRWTQKPRGTVIGSNSIFSQAANKQQNEQDARKEKEIGKSSEKGSPNDKKQEKIISPPRNQPQGRNSPRGNTNGEKKSRSGTPTAASYNKTSGRRAGFSWADEMDEEDTKQST